MSKGLATIFPSFYLQLPFNLTITTLSTNSRSLSLKKVAFLNKLCHPCKTTARKAAFFRERSESGGWVLKRAPRFCKKSRRCDGNVAAFLALCEGGKAHTAHSALLQYKARTAEESKNKEVARKPKALRPKGGRDLRSLSIVRLLRERKRQHLFTPWVIPPVAFAVVILTGAVLLKLCGVSPKAGRVSLSFIDALFMATSATCVTGLSVIDIGTDLTLWGQLVILTLIQVGGIGVMTLSTSLLIFLGRGISFRSRFVLQDTFTHSPRSDFSSLLKRIVFFTVFFELIGAVLLFLGFRKVCLSWIMRAYLALFHSISAFCNAGFSLFPDSMIRFRGDILVNLTMGALIVMGGLGFLVIHEIHVMRKRATNLRRLWNMLSLHTKVVMTTTIALIVAGTTIFLISEWNGTMKGFSLSERLLASLFQAITPRTAGFNTLDFASMNNISIFFTMVLMFIGASPGSTGGGIKTTTFTILLALGWSRFLGIEQPSLFRRTVSADSVNKALVVFVVGIWVVALGTVMLLFTELGCKPFHETDGRFVEYLFEVISAFGTVGLSLGVTPSLSEAGKLVVVLLMFLGRVGPLTFAMAVQTRAASYRYAEEKVMVG